jgi:hypothetical protein
MILFFYNCLLDNNCNVGENQFTMVKAICTFLDSLQYVQIINLKSNYIFESQFFCYYIIFFMLLILFLKDNFA